MTKDLKIPEAFNNLYKCKVSKALKTKTAACLLFIHFLLFNTTYAQLTALQKAPSTASPGSAFIVKLSINRGPIDGFMKFSQALPEGYSAVEVDSKSGDFRFENNETKIIWLKAPKETTYTVAFKIKVPGNATGVITLTGKIIYVTDKNERKVFEFPVEKVTISKTSEKATVSSEKSSPDNKKAETQVKNTPAVTSHAPEKKVQQQQKETPVASAEVPIPALTVKKPQYGFLSWGQPSSQQTSWSTAPFPYKKFRVQVGAFRKSTTIKDVPEHSIIVVNDITKHFSGSFLTYDQAAVRKNQMVEQGFKDAFIVEFPTALVKPEKGTACNTWWDCIPE